MTTKTIHQSIQKNACEHLHELSVKFMSKYIHDVILENKECSVLPNEEEKHEAAVQKIFGQHGLTCICSSMVVHNWLQQLGFKYEAKTKTIT